MSRKLSANFLRTTQMTLVPVEVTLVRIVRLQGTSLALKTSRLLAGGKVEQLE